MSTSLDVTREKWLKTAVATINLLVFDNRFDVSQCQISIGRPKKKTDLGETVIADMDTENPTLDDFFPPTIFISPLIKDEIHIMAAITHELIHAYETMSTKHSKGFKFVAKEIGFDGKYTDYQLTDELFTILQTAIAAVEAECGKWPGIAIRLPAPKEKEEGKEKKSNQVVYFCPECGMELKCTNQMMEDHPGCPTCPCGTKMGIAGDDIQPITEDTQEE